MDYRRSEMVCPVPVGRYPRRQPVATKTADPQVRPSDFDGVLHRLNHMFAYIEKRLDDGPHKEHLLDEVVNISRQIDRAAQRVGHPNGKQDQGL